MAVRSKQIEVIKGTKWNRNILVVLLLLLLVLFFLTSAIGKKVVPSLISAVTSKSYAEASKWWDYQVNTVNEVFFLVLGVALTAFGVFLFAPLSVIPVIGWAFAASVTVVGLGLVWESTKQLLRFGTSKSSGLEGSIKDF